MNFASISDKYFKPFLIIIGAVMFVGGLVAFVTAKFSKKTYKQGIPEQIEQLSKLKEQGIISESEFEKKKQELLARL